MSLKPRIHIRRMRQPGLYWSWNFHTKMPEEYLVDYADRDNSDRLDLIHGINVTDRHWRKAHLVGILLVVSWSSCSSRK